MQEKNIKIIAISGSTRKTSTNHRLIRALQDNFREVFDIGYFDNISKLPHFNPDEDHEKVHPEVSRFRDLLNDSEGIIICTPEYAHGVPGALKNAIDWTVGTGEFSGKPTLLITASTDGQSGHRALLETLKVIEAKNVDTLQLLIPFAATKIDTDNRVTDEKIEEELSRLMKLLEKTIREK